MRAPISVIIPTLNAGAVLADSLVPLGEGLHQGLIRELIVSDGGSSDDTLGIAEAAGAVIVTGAASRGGQLRRGAGVAEGAWLLFLHADTRLTPGWTDPVKAHLASDKAAAFRLAFDSGHPMAWLTAGWANLRSRAFALPYGDQGLLISRKLHDAIGGYPDQPLMEDVAMARKLGRRLVLLPTTAVTSASKYRRDGWIRRGSHNLWTLTRYLAGTPPEILAKRYR